MYGQLKVNRRGLLYASLGLLMFLVAPAGWALFRLVLFYDPALPVWSQFVGDITRSQENVFLYGFIGAGAAAIASVAGYVLGNRAAPKDAAPD